MNWNTLADNVITGNAITAEDAKSILDCPDDELLALMDAVYRVRRHHFGKRVKCCMLINAQSGSCSEDCAYCSQSKISQALIEKYKLVEKEEMVNGSSNFKINRTCNYAIVTSGRGPTPAMVDKICEAISEIRETQPGLEVCASLGILKEGMAEKLQAAGLQRYHHNINTSRRNHDNIVTTHSFEERLETVRMAHKAGLSVCCGVIVGMGETPEDVVDMAMTIRELDVDSIPMNFLAPVEGTPMAEARELTPMYCLKVLALFRMVCPKQDLRLAGGREINLRSLQPLALYAASAMFVGDYLTMKGQGADSDHKMLEDLGFEIEFHEC